MDYKKAINYLIKLKKNFDKIDPKIPKKLVGDLGEYYVVTKLKKRGFSLTQKGGQGGYDILADNQIRIEVRTSLLKNEGIFPKGINFFGWRVENRNQKKKKKFDFLVCVALDDSWLKPKFYIFSYKEAFSVGDVQISRFRNVKKKIQLFENINIFKKALKLEPKLITKYERYINKNPHKFLDTWDKIKYPTNP